MWVFACVTEPGGVVSAKTENHYICKADKQAVAIHMNKTELMRVCYGGVTLMVPEVWNVETETYTEPDGRECAMIDISAVEGDPRSIMISYGPMPEGSDALMEAGGTFEDLIGEDGLQQDEDPICEYDFLGTTGFGFEVPTEDGLACNFICAEVGETKSMLFTILTTAKEYEDIDDLLDMANFHSVL